MDDLHTLPPGLHFRDRERREMTAGMLTALLSRVDPRAKVVVYAEDNDGRELRWQSVVDFSPCDADGNAVIGVDNLPPEKFARDFRDERG